MRRLVLSVAVDMLRHRPRLGAPTDGQMLAASSSRMREADRRVGDVEGVPAQVADAGIDEVDDVAEPEPVDQVAERPAEQQPERDREVRGSGRRGRGTRRSGRRRPASTSANGSAWPRSSPNRPPLFWAWTRRTRSPTTSTDWPGARNEVEPRLRQLVEDDDHAPRAPRNVRPVRSARPRRARLASGGDARLVSHSRDRSRGRARRAAQRDRHRAVGQLDRPVAPSPSRRRPGDLVGERLAGHGGEMRLDLGRQAVDPQLDPRVEVEPGLLAQVLDRALELARVALGAQLGRELRCR